MTIGVLHPGNMGAALAASVVGEVLWSSEGRSEETALRARKAGITDVGALQSLVEAAEVIISVCPPAVAAEVAGRVSGLGFDGLYVDVNAVSPATSRRIGQLFARFVDGGIVGPPPPLSVPRDRSQSGAKTEDGGNMDASSRPGGTRLYLSGQDASLVATLFAGSNVDARVIGPVPGHASALKMAYAAWTKGSSALLLSVASLATAEGVIEDLFDEWDMSVPELRERLERIAAGVGGKAWRFVGEMDEIANSFRDVGLPDGFHLAAAELYSRLAELKDDPAGQLPEEVVKLLLDRDRGS